MDDHETILCQFDTIWFFSNALAPPSRRNAHPEKPAPPQPQPQPLEIPDACESRAPPEPAMNEAGRAGGAEGSPKEPCSEQRRKRTGGGRDQSGRQMQRPAADKENREAPAEGFLHLDLPRRTEKDGGRRRPCHRRAAFGSCRRRCGCNMPCAGDDLAMKQHLKSWAHAVASAVR